MWKTMKNVNSSIHIFVDTYMEKKSYRFEKTSNETLVDAEQSTTQTASLPLQFSNNTL